MNHISYTQCDLMNQRGSLRNVQGGVVPSLTQPLLCNITQQVTVTTIAVHMRTKHCFNDSSRRAASNIVQFVLHDFFIRKMRNRIHKIIIEDLQERSSKYVKNTSSEYVGTAPPNCPNIGYPVEHVK